MAAPCICGLLAHGGGRWAEVGLVLVLDVPCALICPKEGAVGVHPGDDSDELLFGEVALARVLFEPCGQLAEMRAIVQGRLWHILRSPVPTASDRDQSFVKDAFVGAAPVLGRLTGEVEAAFEFLAAVT